jgi:hypothetical protein
MLVAETTWVRKSTSLHHAEQTLYRLWEREGPLEENPYLLALPMTTNALGLWEQRPTGLITVHEIGNWLKQAERLSFMAGIKGAFTELYDCPEQYSLGFKTKEARLFLQRPYINLLVASTVDWLAESLTPQDVGSGFLPRFLYFTAAAEECNELLPWPKGGDEKLQTQVDDQLQTMARLCGSAEFDEAARARYDAWYYQDAMLARSPEGDAVERALRGRAADHVLKLALLYHVSSHHNLKVSAAAVTLACHLTDYLLERIGRLMREELVTSKERALCDRILRVLRRAGGNGLTTRDIYHAANTAKQYAEPALESLQEEGVIDFVETERPAGRGRPGKRWFALE